VPNDPARPDPPVRVSAEVADALRTGRAIVALESSVFAQGLPVPHNREAAERMTAAVRRHGAVPAVTGLPRGVASMGLEADELERFLGRTGIAKVSARDLAWAAVTGADGATTVGASLALCTLVNVEVFATGGIGGVHRDAPFDESSDLMELARSPVVVVCAGAKSVLDLPATVERLETLGVSVVGYRTNEFPGFLTARTGLYVHARADSPVQVAATYRALVTLRRPGALLVVQAPPAASALDAVLVDEAVGAALAAAREKGIKGAAVTPFLLDAVAHATGGRAIEANIALLESNASLAAEIAVSLAQEPRAPRGRARPLNLY
jgi:pseudouridine-5'-phosphate glycosidase